MIRFVLRVVVLLHLLGLELWLLGRAGGITPDASAVLIAFCVLDVRPGRVPYVLLPLAFCRSLLHPGSLPFHLWAVLAAWTCMLPLQRFLFPERWQPRMVIGALAAWGLSFVQAAAFSDAGVDPLGRNAAGIVLTGLVTPGALLVLAALYRGVATPPRSAPVVEGTP